MLRHVASLHADPVDPGRARRAARPDRPRAHALQAALRRPAAAPRRRARRRRATRAGLPRRADRRPRPAGPPRDLGARRGAPPRRRLRRAEHPLHGRGPAPRRPRRRRRPRPRRRRRHAGRADPHGHPPPRSPSDSPPASTAPRCRRRSRRDVVVTADRPARSWSPARSRPQLLAALTTWCADRDLMPDGLTVERRTLEDVFLELTGSEVRA